MDDKTRKLAEHYNQKAEVYAKKAAGRVQQIEIDKLTNYLKPGSKVLEAGCAAGRDCRVLKDLGFEIIGLDIAEKLLEIARRQNPDIKFVQADMRSIPFEDESFDGLYAKAVIHHLDRKEIPQVFQEFKRVLKPGGILFVNTKMGEGILETKKDYSFGEKRKFTLLLSKELDQLLTQAGFEKMELYEYNGKERGGRDLMWISGFYRKRI